MYNCRLLDVLHVLTQLEYLLEYVNQAIEILVFTYNVVGLHLSHYHNDELVYLCLVLMISLFVTCVLVELLKLMVKAIRLDVFLYRSVGQYLMVNVQTLHSSIEVLLFLKVQ